ncbi:MAG: argininosuccinate lyase [Candidatus Bathyarchaeota archaeon]|nr:argininosuccinate lyase [Candidatus Bathyarchaeota archaeon]
MKVGVGGGMSSLFRSRLAREFDERTARFHTSVVEDLRIFEDDIDGTEAHDIMLHERGIIPREALRKILGSLEEIRGQWRRGEVEIGAEYEDVHEYIEAGVIERVGIEVGGMIHTGRSRNDQVVVDMRLRVRDELLETAGQLLELVSALLRRAGEHAETLMMLYTHGQHAQVGTFAHYLVSYADALLRDFERLMECYARVNLNPLGAGPVGGTSIGVDRERTRELLGFDGLVENSIDATSGRDWACEVASVCSILMGNLSRAAADLLEWSTVEFGYVELADEYASSSSIMPQKKNPSTLELIRGKSAEVYGCLVELLTMVKGVNSGYYQDLQQTKIPLWRCLDTTRTSLEVMTGVVSTLKVDAGRMRERLDGSLVVAVELAETLVTGAGLSFREAYRLVAALVRESIEKGRGLSDLKPAEVDRKAREVLGKGVEVAEGILKEATDPEACLKRRSSRGSPNPIQVRKMLELRATLLGEYMRRLKEKEQKVSRAREGLRETVKGYVSG